MGRKSDLIPDLIPDLIKLRIPSMFARLPLIGAKPGTLAIAPGAPPPIVRVIQYSANEATERTLDDLDDLETLHRESGVTWIDVQGLGDEAALRRIARAFEIDDLTLEDMVNVPQRPKIASHADRMLWVMRMVRFDADGLVDREQVSMLHSRNLLITFQERPGDVFEPIRDRIRTGVGRIRQTAADYLAYTLLDTVIDAYYPVVVKVSQTLEQLEALIMQNPRPDQLAAINQTRLLLTTLRRGFIAQERALRSFLHDPGDLVEEPHVPYFADCLDHCQQVNAMVENQREQVTGLLNTYLSMVSYRANEVMKVLTIMASIFIPLTFIAGIYGMNFEYMPELSRRWAYPAALGIMAAVALGMVVFFVRKGWIGEGRGRGFEGVRTTRQAAPESLTETSDLPPVPELEGGPLAPGRTEGDPAGATPARTTRQKKTKPPKKPKKPKPVKNARP